MAEVKIVFVRENESWFWVLSEGVWECWYEEGDTPAIRIPKLDRYVTTGVTDMIADMALTAMNEAEAAVPA